MSSSNNRGGRGSFKQRRSSLGADTIIKFRFLIPSKAATVIIGHRGERIQRLMHECNSRLSIPDSKGPERLFLIESTLDNCVKVWADCFPDLKDIMSVSSRKSGVEMDLRFLCHNSVVGTVIGKGGSKVKDMRIMYQLSLLKVHTDMAPLSTDRVTQIIGPPEKVFECLKIIFADLEEQNIRGPVDNYNPQNFDDKTSLSYGGWSSGGSQFDEVGYNQGNRGRYEEGMSGPHRDHYEGMRNRHPSMDQYCGAKNMSLAEDSCAESRHGPQMDQYGNPRAQPHADAFGGQRFAGPSLVQYRSPRQGSSFNQYEGPKDEASMDQYGGTRNEPLIDEFAGLRNTRPQYDGPRNLPNLDQYRVSRNMSPKNQYCGSRNSENSLNNYGGGPPCNQYDSERNSGFSSDPYGGRRNVVPLLDSLNEEFQYNSGRNSLPPSNQYGVRNVTPLMNQPRGHSAGGIPGNNSLGPGSRNVVPLMEERNILCGYENGGEEFYKPSSNKGQYEDRRPIGGMRRPFSDDRQLTFNKKPRTWDSDDKLSANNVTSSSSVISAGDIDVAIPSEFLSVLQGINGEKLYNIMEDSGANIVVKPDDNSSGERILTLKGTNDQVEGAQYLMQMCIKRSMLNV